EQAVVPQRGLALERREVLVPLARVLAEVELGRGPVPTLPARVQVFVGERVGGQAGDVYAVVRVGCWDRCAGHRLLRSPGAATVSIMDAIEITIAPSSRMAR